VHAVQVHGEVAARGGPPLLVHAHHSAAGPERAHGREQVGLHVLACHEEYLRLPAGGSSRLNEILALAQVEAAPPVVICLGAEREGLPPSVSEEASVRAEIPLRTDGPDSLNVAMAATVALYDLSNRMAADG